MEVDQINREEESREVHGRTSYAKRNPTQLCHGRVSIAHATYVVDSANGNRQCSPNKGHFAGIYEAGKVWMGAGTFSPFAPENTILCMAATGFTPFNPGSIDVLTLTRLVWG
jgi:hypothetical protein